MVLIAGLIGIGLAIEAAERRHIKKNALAKKNSLEEQQDSQDDTQDLAERTQAQIDEQAFLEVQNYADFQKVLSERVNDDLIKEETPTSIYLPATPNDSKQKQAFTPHYLDPSLFAPEYPSGLAFPVVVPQRKSDDGRMLWAQAYAPALSKCGITQEIFCHFIDGFNKIMKGSSRCELVNILAMGIAYYSNMSQLLSSEAVPMAVRLSKRSQSLEPTSTFLRQANSQLFIPHGLYAMVATFSNSDSQIYTVDTPEPSTNHRMLNVEPQMISPSSTIFAEDISSRQSPKRVRGTRKETKKVARRPASRAKAGQKSANVFKNAFQGAFPSRTLESNSVSSGIREMTTGSGENISSLRYFETGNITKDALYLLIVNDTSEAADFMSAAPAIQLPSDNQNAPSRPYLQVDTSNQSWSYTANNPIYGKSDLGPPEQAAPQYTNHPPPTYDYATKGDYDREHTDPGDYSVPTL